MLSQARLTVAQQNNRCRLSSGAGASGSVAETATSEKILEDFT